MELKSKFRGSLLGTGIGDALGRSCEGGPSLQPENVRELVEETDIFRYTDDTQQMVSLAESLSEKEGFDGEHLASRLVENFDPARGYGPGSTRVIRSLQSSESWEEPAQELFGGSGSYGNGSSMRVAPVGLFCFDDLENLRSLARDSSRITHVHRLGMEGAVFQASSVALAVNKDSSSDLDREKFLEDLQDFLVEKEYKEKINQIRELLASDPDKSEVVRTLGNGIEAHNSVPTACYCFLSHFTDFEEAVVYAVSLGGDADTIGAMTGAIAGAYHGSKQIPSELKEKLEDKDRILKLADELFEAKS